MSPSPTPSKGGSLEGVEIQELPQDIKKAIDVPKADAAQEADLSVEMAALTAGRPMKPFPGSSPCDKPAPPIPYMFYTPVLHTPLSVHQVQQAVTSIGHLQHACLEKYLTGEWLMMHAHQLHALALTPSH